MYWQPPSLMMDASHCGHSFVLLAKNFAVSSSILPFDVSVPAWAFVARTWHVSERKSRRDEKIKRQT
jgi:hypothetical protein